MSVSTDIIYNLSKPIALKSEQSKVFTNFAKLVSFLLRVRILDCPSQDFLQVGSIVQGRGKAVPVYTMKAYRKAAGLASLNLTPLARWRRMVKFTLRPP